MLPGRGLPMGAEASPLPDPALRPRDRPWRLLALVLIGTVAMVVLGVDLADGEVALRRFGRPSAAAAPARFAMFGAGSYWPGSLVLFGCLVVLGDWSSDYRLPSGVPLDDPERRRPLGRVQPPRWTRGRTSVPASL